MTEKEINIAIAEARGKDTSVCPVHLSRSCCGRSGYLDYCHDLNAMHEAVLSMDEDNRAMWFNNLCDIVDRKKKVALNAMSLFSLINATAGQRAEAFLRTVGKWKE